MLNACDVSNYTGLITPAQLEAWKAAGVRLVIVQAVAPGPAFPPCVDQQQAQGVLDAGMKLGVYVFHWTGTNAAKENAARFASYGFPVERWWGDFEDTSTATPQQRQAEISDLLAYLDTLGGKRPAGAYSGAWWINGYLPVGSQAFAGRDLWLSTYDGVAELDQQALAGGNAVPIKQFADTSTLLGVHNVDLNIAAESEFMDTSTPADDPCAALQVAHDALVTTVADIADRLGDLLLAEADHLQKPMRRWYVRSIVVQMQNERKQSIGKRPQA